MNAFFVLGHADALSTPGRMEPNDVHAPVAVMGAPRAALESVVAVNGVKVGTNEGNVYVPDD